MDYVNEINDEYEKIAEEINNRLFKHPQLNKNIDYEKELIKFDVYQRLMECGLDSIIDNYLESYSIISIDFDDIIHVVHERKIVNYYNGNINLNNPISFNFIETTDSRTILIVESNSNIKMSDINKVIDTVKEKIKNTCIIFARYNNDRLEDNQIKVLIINTIAEDGKGDSTVVEKEIDKDYNLDDIAKLCKENNNYSINFIQSITNLGFCKCQIIRNKILN